MSHKNKSDLQIQSRDCELFEYLFLHKVATTSQISRDIFHTTSVRDLLKRLRKLIRWNYIQRVTVEVGKPIFAYHLTGKTFERYFSKRVKRRWIQLKSDSPLHDVKLLDIRRRLLKSKKVELFLTENALESKLDSPCDFPVDAFVEMHSDGAIIFKNNDRKFNVAIEYENSSQGSPRYEEQFMEYYADHDIKGVIYIVNGKSLYDRLKKIDLQFCTNRKSKLFFGEISEVLNSEGTLEFPNNTGEVLCID